MSKGALPVPYIVALIIAIAVIAVLGYWFFVLSSQSGSEADRKKCEAVLVTYCTAWKATNYNSDEKTGAPLIGEWKDYPLGGECGKKGLPVPQPDSRYCDALLTGKTQ